MSGEVLGQTGKGVFTIVEVSNGWGHLKSGAGWIWLGNEQHCTIIRTESKENPENTSFIVRVEIPALRIRKGPGTNYDFTGSYLGIGAFTIIEVASGVGSDTGWGRLKSGAGWISGTRSGGSLWMRRRKNASARPGIRLFYVSENCFPAILPQGFPRMRSCPATRSGCISRPGASACGLGANSASSGPAWNCAWTAWNSAGCWYRPGTPCGRMN